MIFCRILNSHHNGLPDNKVVSSIVIVISVVMVV